MSETKPCEEPGCKHCTFMGDTYCLDHTIDHLKADLRVSNHLFAVATDKQRELEIEIMQLSRMNAELIEKLKNKSWMNLEE